MIARITPSQVTAWAQAHAGGEQKPLVIDVREPFEWQIAQVQSTPDYEVQQLSMGNIPSEMNLLDPDRPTALLCHHGQRSQMVASFLHQNGFTELANIEGGIDAWSAIDSSIPFY